MSEDKFSNVDDEQTTALSSMHVFEPTLPNYEFDAKYKTYEGSDPNQVNSIPSLIKYLESNENSDIEAEIIQVSSKNKTIAKKKLNKESFIKEAKSSRRPNTKKFKEAFDSFDYVGFDDGSSSIVGGADYIPALGGPFTKQLYYYDFLKQANSAFFAYHHDPIAKGVLRIMLHFILGRGFRADCKNKRAVAIWEAFSKANNFGKKFEQMALESMTYGETMLRWLPGNQLYQSFDDKAPTGIIPRIYVTDPTVCWDICTLPEDIEQVMFYQLIYPTQWQMFTDGQQPSTKFIYKQIPANEMMHFKLNSMSNEKRGRSDLFPVLGYLKRMRDSVEYGLIADLKKGAWCIDTEIDGSQKDISDYIASQKSIGTVAPAGSEFVHSSKVKRVYNSNAGSTTSTSETFQTVLSMIAMGCNIPTSYFGTHLASGSTRAGSIVATEPVAKFFECRQLFLERMLIEISRRVLDQFGIKDELEFTFPEIITQDRSAKFKDLALAQSEGWISKKRASEMAAKELGITDFDFDKEQIQINQEPVSQSIDSIAPLSDNPFASQKSSSALTSEEKKDAKDSSYV